MGEDRGERQGHPVLDVLCPECSKLYTYIYLSKKSFDQCDCPFCYYEMIYSIKQNKLYRTIEKSEIVSHHHPHLGCSRECTACSLQQSLSSRTQQGEEIDRPQSQTHS